MLIINGIFAFFFFRFSYSNPDEGQCFAKDEIEAASASAIKGYTNVSWQFEWWFWWGLILNCAGFVFSSGAFIYACTENS